MEAEATGGSQTPTGGQTPHRLLAKSLLPCHFPPPITSWRLSWTQVRAMLCHLHQTQTTPNDTLSLGTSCSMPPPAMFH